jgi:hypothetical protein
MGVIGVTVLVVGIEMARRSELLFLANLGHSFFPIAAFIVAECIGFEALVRLLGG